MRLTVTTLLLLALAFPIGAETIVGTVSTVRDTDWARGCDGIAIKDFYKSSSFNCIAIDNEIVAIKVTNARSLSTLKHVSSFYVLVPAPVAKHLSMSIVVKTTAASANIAADTGISLWADEFWLRPQECGDTQPMILTKGCLSLLRERFGNEP